METTFETPYLSPRPWNYVMTRWETVKHSEFCRVVRNFFKPYIDAAPSVSDIDWNCVPRSIAYFLPYLNEYSLAEQFIECLFTLFEDCCCTDNAVIQNVLEQYVFLRLWSYGYREISDSMETSGRRFRYCMNHPLRKIFIPKTKVKMGFITLDWLLSYFLFQDLEFIERLFQYGIEFNFMPSEASRYLPYSLLHFTEHPWHLLFPLNDREGDNSDIDYENHRSELVYFLNDIYGTTISQKRLQIMLSVINLFMIKRFTRKFRYFQNSIIGLKLYFETITEPLLTIPEIRSLLNLITAVTNKNQIVGELCKDMETAFPRSTDPLQPRTLQHLSRCKVRKSLKQAKKMPHGVWALHIPKKIANYILLQKRKKDFRTSGTFISTKKLKYIRIG